jgi:hypothetical protein
MNPYLNNPKYIKHQANIYNMSILLARNGDIHPNLGPIRTLLHGLPKEYHQRQKQHFTLDSILLKEHSAHLAHLFDPYLNHLN